MAIFASFGGHQYVTFIFFFSSKSVKLPLLSVVVDFTQILLQIYSILAANLLNSPELTKYKSHKINNFYIFLFSPVSSADDFFCLYAS